MCRTDRLVLFFACVGGDDVTVPVVAQRCLIRQRLFESENLIGRPMADCSATRSDDSVTITRAPWTFERIGSSLCRVAVTADDR